MCVYVFVGEVLELHIHIILYFNFFIYFVKPLNFVS